MQQSTSQTLDQIVLLSILWTFLCIAKVRYRFRPSLARIETFGHAVLTKFVSHTNNHLRVSARPYLYCLQHISVILLPSQSLVREFVTVLPTSCCILEPRSSQADDTEEMTLNQGHPVSNNLSRQTTLALFVLLVLLLFSFIAPCLIA